MREAKIRIKTKKEFDRLQECWNIEGATDHLFGEVKDALIDADGDAYVDDWWIFKGQFEILEWADSEIALSPLVRIRIKTEEELGGRPAEWNQNGRMDYLFGRIEPATRMLGGSPTKYLVLNRNPEASEKRVWCLLSDQIEILGVLDD